MHVKHYYVDLSSSYEFRFAIICINMNVFFLFFYHNPTILETVSIASEWVYTDLNEISFLLKYNDKE